MNRRDGKRIRESFEWFAPCGPAMIAMMMRKLSDRNVHVRGMFPPDAEAVNRTMFETLRQVVTRIDRFETLERPLAELGIRCAKAGATAADYAVVRDELLSVMEEIGGDDWDHRLSQEWREVLDAVAGAMLAGAVRGAERLAA
jgi:hemoglobin-like flavoprotein